VPQGVHVERSPPFVTFGDSRQLQIAIEDANQSPQVEQAARRLRDRWREWQGEDSLHEMAFGEP